MYDSNAAVVDYDNDWKEVFGDIDANQTWNTSTTSKVSVSSDAAGTIRIFAGAAIGNQSAALVTKSIKAGETLSLTIAKPQWATELYAAYYDANGYITEENFDVADNASVAFTTAADAASAKSSLAKTRASLIDKFNSMKYFEEYDASGFDKTIPEDAVDISESSNGTQGKKFKVSETTTSIDVQSGGSELYFGPGTYNLNSLTLGNSTNVYILSGATVTLADNQIFDASNDDINVYINEGATFNTNRYSANVYTYNRGTINVGSEGLAVTSNQTMFVNEGKVNVTGAADIWGRFWNVNEIQITGTTTIKSNGEYWVNDNLYHTGELVFKSKGTTAINNCKVIVDGTTTINVSSDIDKNKFFINSGAYLKTQKMSFNNGIISMADNAMVKVDGTVKMKLESSYTLGVEGVGSDSSNPALFLASAIEATKDKPTRIVSYTGNLVIAADKHFSKVDDGVSCYTVAGGATIAQTQNSAGVNFTATQCHPGYENNATTIATGYVYYAFEDLGGSNDFDFNDVVVRVSAPQDGKSTIELCAAGGTIATYVYYDGKTIGQEVHAAFGVDEGTMVNTTSVNKDFVTLGTIDVADGTDISNLDIAIMITGQTSREVAAPVTGTAPMMIRVSGDESGKWMWPIERGSISTAYPSFGSWGANYGANTEWYNNPVSGKVVSY